MATATLSLKGRALKYLAAREHSRLELARKLARATDEPPERIDAVLDELQARGLLSTARYVESVVHRRAPTRGAALVKRELLAQGVDNVAMGDALSALRDSELARAAALWQRRYGVVAADAKTQARQTRFLLARGFSAEAVRRVVRGEAISEPE